MSPISYFFYLFIYFLLQALEEALNLHTPSASQQPPAQGNFADAANNLKKQELLTQIAVLKEQVRQIGKHAHKNTQVFWNYSSVFLISWFCTSGEDLWGRLQKREEWQGADEWGKGGLKAASWETPGSDYQFDQSGKPCVYSTFSSM